MKNWTTSVVLFSFWLLLIVQLIETTPVGGAVGMSSISILFRFKELGWYRKLQP